MTPLSPPDFTGVKAEQLMQVLQRCEQGSGDEVLSHFESDFSKLSGSKYVVSVSSATAGLHLALVSLGVSESDVVICPTFTFAASAFPIVYQKATPVFVDSETETWNMSPEYLERAIKIASEMGKKPKAVILVHAYGTPAKLEELLFICNKHHIPVIEDAANALGSTFDGKQVGSLGKIGVFSFNRNKIISAAGGGCIVTDDKIVADRIRYFAHQAKSPLPYYHHENLGYNYGLSPILAEVVRVQLPTLHDRVAERRHIFSQYTQLLTLDAFWQKETKNAISNRWLSVMGWEDAQHTNKLFRLAEKQEVEVRNTWKPMHQQPFFDKTLYVGNKESEVFFQNAICLPYSTKIIDTYLPVLIPSQRQFPLHV